MATTLKKKVDTSTDEKKVPVTKEAGGIHHPLLGLRQEVDNLFDNFFSSFSLGPFGRTRFEFDPFRKAGRHLGLTEGLLPDMDVRQTGDEFRVSVELPGMGEDDFDITIENGSLIIKGEKEEKKEEDTGDRYVSERRYGSVYRSVPMPHNIDQNTIKATFEKGVLDVVVPMIKEPEATTRKIEVETR